MKTTYIYILKHIKKYTIRLITQIIIINDNNNKTIIQKYFYEYIGYIL